MTITLYHGTKKENLPSILKRGLLPSNKTKVITGYPTNKDRVFLTTDIEEAKFYTKLHKDWAIIKATLTQKDYKKFAGKLVGGQQHSLNKVLKSKIKLYLSN